jgi:hypothetical protein
MFAPRRLCAYPPPLLASTFSTALSPLSPLFPLDTRKQGGTGGLRHPQSQVLLSISTAVVPSPKRLTIIDSVTYPINVGAPTFPVRESPVFLFPFSNFLSSAPLLPHLKLITVHLQPIVGAPTFSNCARKEEKIADLKIGHYKKRKAARLRRRPLQNTALRTQAPD